MIPLLGTSRDVLTLQNMNREVINRTIRQQIGYYKIDKAKTVTNIYGESQQKFYLDPVVMTGIVDLDDPQQVQSNGVRTTEGSITVSFLREDLVIQDIFIESGDILFYNGQFFEINRYVSNQHPFAHNPEFAYTDDLKDVGASWSVTVTATFVSPDKLGLDNTRY